MNQITYGQSRSSMIKTLNILLMGKSGIGKTTFVNSFSNYVSFESVDDIQDRNAIKVPIPCTFDICDDDDIFHNFKMGEEINQDGNESMNSIKSGTLGCKSYEFDFKDLRINFIDTPGIVDTEGIEKGKKNIEAILDFISIFTSIDAICILTKPNEERLDPVLRYCIFELLCQLDKSAAQNICLVFTNARSTLYKRGSTAVAIRHLIDEIHSKKPDLELKFSKENCFLFDSEAFRFLISKDTVKFDDDEKNMFMQSWDKSRKECVRMINYISGLPQHNVRNMISINKARRMIKSLQKPLVDIADDIMESQQMCLNHEQEIIAAQGDINLLKSKLYVPRTNVIMEYYNYPRLVCNSKNCTERFSDDAQEKTHYKKVCYQMDVSLERGWQSILTCGTAGMVAMVQQAIGSLGLGSEAAAAAAAAPVLQATIPAVLGGAAVLGVVGAGALGYYYIKGSCSSCSCAMSEHFLSFYETRKTIERIKDLETSEKMETEENCLVVAEAALRNLHRELEQLKKENEIIGRASCTFALFLERRAITLYNDATVEYLNYMLEVNQHDHRLSPQDRAAKQMRLEKQKKRYHKQKEAIRKGCERGSEAFNGNEILPRHIFREALEKIEQMKNNEYRHRAVKCSVSDSWNLFRNRNAIEASF